ncbi:MAG: hypothetical protein AMJ60_07695 [Desulfobacterales bacterium SG8_35]|nr:MAG: hypothetical protein AMJ60_07695 [Desulfobacterales bacterium SG8_35]
MPDKLTQFWQELKRRKVIRVITVYAASAFVILELTDIVAEPLKLPSWLLPVVIVLLAVGFIIAIILSWIYDIQPEGGLIKTESTEKASSQEIQKTSGCLVGPQWNNTETIPNPVCGRFCKSRHPHWKEVCFYD